MLVIFDLDGTLIDSTEAWLLGYKLALAPRKSDISEHEIITEFFFKHHRLSEYGITDAKAFYTMLDDTVLNRGDLVKAILHAKEAVEKIKERGHTTAVLTARKKEIAAAHLPEWIDALIDVFIDRDDAPSKPAPQGVYAACQLTGIPLKDAVLIGDHTMDYECATAAGIPFLQYRVPTGRFSFEIPNARSFGDFRELPGLIENMARKKSRK